jgi:hypothetical protein
MADIPVGTPSFDVVSADNYVLGNASDAISSVVIVQGTLSTFTGTGLIVKGRVRGAPTAPWVPIPYVRRMLVATASDDTVVIAALPTAFLIRVEASGLDISLDASGGGWASGKMAVNVSRVEGGLR